ncbi:MAG: MoaD/ThiS family protein [Promethearchaeota archaeon]
MQITVRYLSIIREITGRREEIVKARKGSTVEDLIGILIDKYGEAFRRISLSGRERRGLQIVYFLNGQNIKALDDFKTKIPGVSELVIIPPVAGGCGG